MSIVLKAISKCWFPIYDNCIRMVKNEFFLIPEDWEYRGEGNCHVVIGLPKLKKVLRIRKRDKPKNIVQWFIYFIENFLPWWCDRGARAEELDLSFYLNIMRPLLGLECVSNAEQVKLFSVQVKQIEDQLNNIRPDFRKHKILHYGRATLFQDFTTLNIDNFPLKLSENTISIEIKPKKGWIAFRERTFPECVFCLNQYMKVKTQKISRRSRYCPKDLFSGNETKMRESILKLLDNPQNNIRIFHNSTIIYNEDSDRNILQDILYKIFEYNCNQSEELINDFVYLILNCLTRKIESYEICETNTFCQSNLLLQASALPKGCILQKILSVQMLDIEGTAFYYECIQERRLSEWQYVRKLLNKLDDKICIKCNICSMSMIADVRNDDLAIAPYLVAAVANDCSIIISLKKILDEDERNFESNKIIKSKFGKFLWNVGIVDLYPKPLSTVKKHELRNRHLLQMYGALRTKESSF